MLSRVSFHPSVYSLPVLPHTALGRTGYVGTSQVTPTRPRAMQWCRATLNHRPHSETGSVTAGIVRDAGEDAMDAGDLVRAVDRVVRRCQRAGLSPAEAEDCVHEALLAMLTRYPEQVGDCDDAPIEQVEAWLGVTAHRKLVDHLRRSQRERNALARLHAAAPPAPDPSEVVAEQALAIWLIKALRELPATTQQVCRLVAEGVSTEETAARLGLTCRSVQSHLTRARRLLRHLAAGAAAALACAALRLTRHTTTAVAATAPTAVTAAAMIGVTLLPHHTPVQHVTAQASPPPASSAPPQTQRAGLTTGRELANTRYGSIDAPAATMDAAELDTSAPSTPTGSAQTGKSCPRDPCADHPLPPGGHTTITTGCGMTSTVGNLVTQCGNGSGVPAHAAPSAQPGATPITAPPLNTRTTRPTTPMPTSATTPSSRTHPDLPATGSTRGHLRATEPERTCACSSPRTGRMSTGRAGPSGSPAGSPGRSSMPG
ncbi:sigma-70 family RNA polymerase sigma factor [Lentzea roselyniae]|uniref:sigma-70 family RNA polymerase sigma factor n=1 Tax=Lentzea roselyniae TaxID=531940 RepID=UPI0031F9A044